MCIKQKAQPYSEKYRLDTSLKTHSGPLNTYLPTQFFVPLSRTPVHPVHRHSPFSHPLKFRIRIRIPIFFLFPPVFQFFLFSPLFFFCHVFDFSVFPKFFFYPQPLPVSFFSFSFWRNFVLLPPLPSFLISYFSFFPKFPFFAVSQFLLSPLFHRFSTFPPFPFFFPLWKNPRKALFPPFPLFHHLPFRVRPSETLPPF